MLIWIDFEAAEAASMSSASEILRGQEGTEGHEIRKQKQQHTHTLFGSVDFCWENARPPLDYYLRGNYVRAALFDSAFWESPFYFFARSIL